MKEPVAILIAILVCAGTITWAENELALIVHGSYLAKSPGRRRSSQMEGSGFISDAWSLTRAYSCGWTLA